MITGFLLLRHPWFRCRAWRPPWWPPGP